MEILSQQVEAGDHLHTDPDFQVAVAGKRANTVTAIEVVTAVVEAGSTWHFHTSTGNHFVYPVDYHVTIED